MSESASELVRIDSKGQAHPIGSKASQQLRARAGTFRMLPSPQHIVFLRYTGEDGRRDPNDGAIVRLAGEIVHASDLCDILALVGQTRWRGELRVMTLEHQRSLFLDQGSVVAVETTAENERFGSILYRFGAITQAQHAQLMLAVAEGRRAGGAAVDLGLIRQEDAFKYLRKQMEEVVYAALTCHDGTYFFLDGFDETRLVSRQAVGANALLMDCVTRLDEIQYFRERVPSPEHVPHRRTDQEGPANTELQETWGLIDGERSVAELGRVTGRGEFAVTRDLYNLVSSRHVSIGPPPLTGGLNALVMAANEALRALHEAAIRCGKDAELVWGLVSFASGAGLYDVLFQGAGPDELGMFVPERVAANSSRVSRDEPGLILRQMLHEYVGFALFCAGSTLGSEVETELKRTVGPLLAQLQPPG